MTTVPKKTKPTDLDNSVKLAPHRDVERYVAFPITVKMQEQLETFLEGHPEADIEIACITLLQVALNFMEIEFEETRRARSNRNAELGSRIQKAEERVQLAESLYRRAVIRCCP